MTMSDQQETQRAFWRPVIMFQQWVSLSSILFHHEETDANSALSLVAAG